MSIEIRRQQIADTLLEYLDYLGGEALSATTIKDVAGMFASPFSNTQTAMVALALVDKGRIEIVRDNPVKLRLIRPQEAND